MRKPRKPRTAHPDYPHDDPVGYERLLAQYLLALDLGRQLYEQMDLAADPPDPQWQHQRWSLGLLRDQAAGYAVKPASLDHLLVPIRTALDPSGDKPLPLLREVLLLAWDFGYRLGNVDMKGREKEFATRSNVFSAHRWMLRQLLNRVVGNASEQELDTETLVAHGREAFDLLIPRPVEEKRTPGRKRRSRPDTATSPSEVNSRTSGPGEGADHDG